MPKSQIIDTKDKSLPAKDQVITQALSRFRDCESYERDNREEYIDDLNMLAGLNHWPDSVVKERKQDGRPYLTINKLPGFANRVANKGRINKISIKVLPNGEGATKETAEVLNGLIRTIEVNSNATSCYQNAHKSAVQGGFGYFRVITDYFEETSFDLEIFIRRIKNSLSVYMDPAHTELDGSDCRFIFVTELISVDEYKIRYPNEDPPEPLPSEESFWCGEEQMVRVGEYWVKEPATKKLYLLSDGRTVYSDEWDKVVPTLKKQEKVIHYVPAPIPPTTQNPVDPSASGTGPLPEAGAPSPDASSMSPVAPPVPTPGPAPEGSGYEEEIINKVPEIVREREIKSYTIKSYFIDGSKVIGKPSDWPGMYIPIIPVWGEEIVIDDKTHRRGVIRFAKDPQRMYNYFRTAATETVALTPKAPYVIADDQLEGFESEWEQANTKNAAYLPYHHVTGVPIPQRQVMTQTAIGEITEANISGDEMKDTTSIQDASLGATGNEVSGVAISRRQSQSDVANYTYYDNLIHAIGYCGKILVDLIPRIYDTQRQLVLTNNMDEEEPILVNQEIENPVTGEKVIINDLSMGKHKVTTIAGPSFNTQQEEAAAGMLDMVRTAPETAKFVMDLIAESQNWPMATKIANRLKKLLPPGIDDEGPAPPPEPSIDEVIKRLKVEGMTLGNQKKKLDIVETRRDLSDESAGAKRISQIIKLIKELETKDE